MIEPSVAKPAPPATTTGVQSPYIGTVTPHVHVFKHQGGGCLVVELPPEEEKNRCDDHYKCDCGLEFWTHSDAPTHFAMPQEIQGRADPWDPRTGKAPP